MTHIAIALYLGESYATACAFDITDSGNSAVRIEKSVYLPQTSLKVLINQLKALLPANSEIKSVFVVTRYLDRLKTFRLGGSVVQVVPAGFENSYSLANTQLQSLAAPALILPVEATIKPETLKTDLAKLRKVNSEINKVVFQLPETYFSPAQSHAIKDFFAQHEFKLFSVPNPLDFQSVRKTLLNAGSEGTKEEIVTDILEVSGTETKIYFWVNDGFTEKFENIDLYFSSQNFISCYLKKKKQKHAFYFDLENWNLISTEHDQQWLSPWGAIEYSHPKNSEFSLSPYAELVVDAVGQLVVSSAVAQFEPGPIIAGRSVKTLILDVFSEEIKAHPRLNTLFPQLASDNLQQKINTQFQIMQKAQSLDEVRMTKNEIKDWLKFSVTTWMLQNQSEQSTLVLGDMSHQFFGALKKKNGFAEDDFTWADQIITEARIFSGEASR